MKYKRICMLAHSYLPEDDRIFREANALIERKYNVDIICLKKPQQRFTESINGIRIIRVPIQRNRLRGIMAYGLEYFGFAFVAALILWTRMFFRNYRVIHTHNPPDFLLWAMLPLKLFGVKAIFDIHDPGPEMAMSKWDIEANHYLVKLWRVFEKISIKCADRIIVTNSVDLILLRKRNQCPVSKFHIVMNTPDLHEYLSENGTARPPKNEIHLLYEGMVSKRRGVQTVLEALAILRRQRQLNCYLTIAGNGDYLPALQEHTKRLGLENQVEFTGHVDKARLFQYIDRADICFIPFLHVPINVRGVPNKLFEYMSFHKPIVAANLLGITSVVSEQNVWLFEAGQPKSMAERIAEILDQPAQRQAKLGTYRSLLQSYNWEVTKQKIWACYETV